MARDVDRPLPDSLGECRDEVELAEYLHRVYGLDHVPTLEELRANSVPVRDAEDVLGCDGDEEAADG